MTERPGSIPVITSTEGPENKEHTIPNSQIEANKCGTTQ